MVLNEFTGAMVLEGKVAMLVFVLLSWLPIFHCSKHFTGGWHAVREEPKIV